MLIIFLDQDGETCGVVVFAWGRSLQADYFLLETHPKKEAEENEEEREREKVREKEREREIEGLCKTWFRGPFYPNLAAITLLSLPPADM